MKYEKPSLDIRQQVDLLKERGLIIEYEDNALHYLQYIGYYRLSAYMIPYQNDGHNFIDGTSFKDILDLYIFDRKLRIITFDAIERIEVAFRSTITNVMSEMGGSHWFEEKKLFENEKGYKETLENIRNATIDSNPRKRDVFINHYYNKYDAPDTPPSWMVFETLSMGAVSRVYKYLKRPSRKKIAKLFQTGEPLLVSWMHSLSYTRNLAAHHARLWNRVFTIKPHSNKHFAEYNEQTFSTHYFYAQAIVIEALLRQIAPKNSWEESLKDLFEEFPKIEKSKMGFPDNWNGFRL